MKDSLINQIVALFRGGASMRRIARSLGVGRRTRRRAVEARARPVPGLATGCSKVNEAQVA